MIVASRKPLDEIKAMVSGCKRVLIAGCDTCVAVCMAGGRKEVDELAATLDLAMRQGGTPVEFVTTSVERQCEPEFVDEMRELVGSVDLVLSLACGIGVQTTNERFADKRTVPGVNTTFLGAPEEQGVWTERCAACGNCVLEKTGGICPVSRCSKSLLNGPCGGSADGKCEVDPEKIQCAWQLIYDRLEALGQLDRMDEIEPIKDWSTSRDGGVRRRVREDMVL